MALRPICILTVAAAALAAQPKAFDVATIKPNASNDNRVMFRLQPGGFMATGVPVRMLIGQAFDVRDFQITGGPGWMSSDRWDVNAKAEGMPDRPGMALYRPLIQNLLEDRFQLKFHKETKEMPVYALVAGKGPHKMKASEAAPAGAGPRGMFRLGRGQATLQGATMAALAQTLSQQLGRPVLDKTGIAGNFDIELNWTPEPGQGGGPFGHMPPGAPPPPPADNGGPSIFTAIQEQLGLKLETTKGPVEIIVVDSIAKPSEN